MKIIADRWILVSPQGRRQPIIYNGQMAYTRAFLIEYAEKRFHGGTTWANLKKNGWRAVKVKIRGRL